MVIFEESHQLAYNLLTAKNNLDEKFIFVEFDQDNLFNLSIKHDENQWNELKIQAETSG